MLQKKKGLSLWLERVGYILGVIYVIYWLFISISVLTGMDFQGLGYLLPAFLMLILLFLCRRSLSLGGLVLVIAGLALSIRYYLATEETDSRWLTALVTGGPFFITGFLFLASEWLANRKNIKTDA
jgi:hypothetical protein